MSTRSIKNIQNHWFLQHICAYVSSDPRLHSHPNRSLAYPSFYFKNHSKMVSKTPPTRSKTDHENDMASKRQKIQPKMHQKTSKKPPSRPRTPPGRLQDAPRTPPRRPQTASKSSPLLISLSRPQNHGKKRPKRPPRYFLNASKTITTQRQGPCIMIEAGDGATSQ